MRFIEELQCLQVEMESAVRFFRHQGRFWEEKRKLIEDQSQPGHLAWAARQRAMWCSMATQAELKFTALLKNDLPPEFARVFKPTVQPDPNQITFVSQLSMELPSAQASGG